MSLDFVYAKAPEECLAVGAQVDPGTLYINTDNIQMYHKNLGLAIDVSDDILNQIDSININGYKFTKSK